MKKIKKNDNKTSDKNDTSKTTIPTTTTTTTTNTTNTTNATTNIKTTRSTFEKFKYFASLLLRNILIHVVVLESISMTLNVLFFNSTLLKYGLVPHINFFATLSTLKFSTLAKVTRIIVDLLTLVVFFISSVTIDICYAPSQTTAVTIGEKLSAMINFTLISLLLGVMGYFLSDGGIQHSTMVALWAMVTTYVTSLN